jgi:hypothetical protein
MKNLPVYDININKLIISYFSMYLKKGVMIGTYISSKLKRLSLYKIYISKPEIKHTNSKVIITLYIFNKEHLSLLTKLKRTFFIRKEHKEFLFFNRKEVLKKNLFFLIKITKDLKNLFSNKILLFFLERKIMFNYNMYNTYYKNVLKFILHKELSFIRKYKLKLSINKYKLKDIFLYKLSNLISKFYNKKVEFNIINLQSIALSSDIFTEFSKLKLKKKRHKLLGAIHFILAKVKLPEVNTIMEKGRLVKNIDFNLLENKYKNLNINSIINNNFDNTFNELYENVNNNDKEKNFIFDNIKYKNIGGVKLEVKGRLTKRYRADRAIYRIKLKGGLKNIDSSFKGLSTVNFKGYMNSNLEYSIQTGKRRIGAFAVKG